MKQVYLIILLFLPVGSNAQTYYVTSVVNVPLSNKGFQLDASNCDSTKIFSCKPTNDTLQWFENVFYDIAIDSAQNIYYASGWGSLYKRNLSDTTSCQFLGSFNKAINALVVDSQKTIYAAGNQYGVCTLYKYDISTGTFDSIGNLPPAYFSAGDLFFYEHKLYLTCTNFNFTSSSLIEVDAVNPSLSCHYMELQDLQSYGAFSVTLYSGSRAYILSKNSNTSSDLIEIDMPGHTIGAPICTFPFLVAGAAAFYNLSSNTASCAKVSGISNISPSALYIKINNPTSDFIRIETNVNTSNIQSITMVDCLNKSIRTFRSIQDLNISDISAGLYLFQIKITGGMVLSAKVIKTSD